MKKLKILDLPWRVKCKSSPDDESSSEVLSCSPLSLNSLLSDSVESVSTSKNPTFLLTTLESRILMIEWIIYN